MDNKTRQAIDDAAQKKARQYAKNIVNKMQDDNLTELEAIYVSCLISDYVKQSNNENHNKSNFKSCFLASP